MKKAQFNKIIKENSDKKTKLLMVAKISSIENKVRNEMINYIVKKRMAIVKEFLNTDTDMSWLASCGYLYHAINAKGFSLLCTCENLPKK